MVTDRRSDPTKPPLSRTVQLRFTDAQYQLLGQVADEIGRSIGQVVRDVVTVWAISHQIDVPSGSERLTSEQVLELVAELQALEDVS